MSSSACIKRLQRELQEIKKNPPSNCSADVISSNDISKWKAQIYGPKDTPFEGGTFNLELFFGKEYPFKAPTVKFTTRVYHPNISRNGEICLDILKSQWSPALSVQKVLLSVCSLLTDPNPSDPLVTEAANLYISNQTKYNERVKEYVKEYASGKLSKEITTTTKVTEDYSDDDDDDDDEDEEDW